MKKCSLLKLGQDPSWPSLRHAVSSYPSFGAVSQCHALSKRLGWGGGGMGWRPTCSTDGVSDGGGRRGGGGARTNCGRQLGGPPARWRDLMLETVESASARSRRRTPSSGCPTTAAPTPPGSSTSPHSRPGPMLRSRCKPESNGIAEAFVKTFKRDYARINPLPDAETVLRQLAGWFDDYNQNHPHSGLGMRSPKEFIQAHATWRPALTSSRYWR